MYFRNLSKDFHNEFLIRFYKNPYSEELINYLNRKIKKNIERLILKEVSILKEEVMKEIFLKDPIDY